MNIEIKEAKSLRWLAIQFPYNEKPKSEIDKLNNAIHIYATEGAKKIEEQAAIIKKISEEYLEICEKDCTRDRSVGIPSCPFYQWPDVTEDGHTCPGGCELKSITGGLREVKNKIHKGLGLRI